jgi:hypothetical protein
MTLGGDKQYSNHNREQRGGSIENAESTGPWTESHRSLIWRRVPFIQAFVPFDLCSRTLSLTLSAHQNPYSVCVLSRNQKAGSLLAHMSRRRYGVPGWAERRGKNKGKSFVPLYYHLAVKIIKRGKFEDFCLALGHGD